MVHCHRWPLASAIRRIVKPQDRLDQLDFSHRGAWCTSSSLGQALRGTTRHRARASCLGRRCKGSRRARISDCIVNLGLVLQTTNAGNCASQPVCAFSRKRTLSQAPEDFINSNRSRSRRAPPSARARPWRTIPDGPPKFHILKPKLFPRQGENRSPSQRRATSFGVRL